MAPTTPARPAAPRPWPGVLWRASLLPTAVSVALLAAGVGVRDGAPSAAGAALGGALVVGSFGLGLWVAHATGPLHPVAALTGALMSYLFTVTALLLVAVLVHRTAVVDRGAAGAGVLVAVLVWLAAQVRAFTRLPLHVDPAAVAPGGPGAARAGDPGETSGP